MNAQHKLATYADLFHPSTQPSPDGTSVAFDQVSPWSTHPYTWECPTHSTLFTATPNRIVRGKIPIWLVACSQCAQERHTLTVRNPQLAQHATGWNPTTVPISHITATPMPWTCPGCGDTVHAKLATLTRGGRIEKATPNRITTHCPRCAKRTLTDHPHLATQFVKSGHDGETDPAKVVYTHRETARHTRTQWQCATCHTTFTMAVNSAMQVPEGTQLHRPCRTANVERRLAAQRRKAEKKEAAMRAKLETKIAAMRTQLAAEEERVRKAKLAKQREKSAAKKRTLAKKHHGEQP